MPTKTLSRQLNPEMKTFIMRAIQEILSDPDFGLELSEEAKRRLGQASRLRKKSIPLSEVKKKYY